MSRDTFCSVRAIKRGSGALVNTEERDSARRQQHGSARDNMISALLGPPPSATRCSTGIIVWGQRGDTEAGLHPPHGSYLFPIDLLKEVTHRPFFLMPVRSGEVVSPLFVSGKIIFALSYSGKRADIMLELFLIVII